MEDILLMLAMKLDLVMHLQILKLVTFVVDKEKFDVKFNSVIDGKEMNFLVLSLHEDLNNGYKSINFGGFDDDSITINDDSNDNISQIIKSIKYHIKELSESELSTGQIPLNF